jgi:hypothetical protein
MELWEPEGALMEPATKSHAHVAYWEERSYESVGSAFTCMGEGLRSSVHTSQCHGNPMDGEWAVKWTGPGKTRPRGWIERRKG